MRFKLVLLVLAVSSQPVLSEPSQTDLEICKTVYKNCTDQQKAGKVNASCLSYEKDNPEIIKYLKMVDDGLLKAKLDVNSSPWELALASCNLQYGIFKSNEMLSGIPDSSFKSGVNEFKYIIEE
ncbi:hypothetical protein ACLHZ0_21010 [Aeromonas salmonicida]|uniref:hypothetical protein n=1 Tax=Aeromonas salmonicida TaxID=645 RepID=UPI003CFDAD2B